MGTTGFPWESHGMGIPWNGNRNTGLPIYENENIDTGMGL